LNQVRHEDGPIRPYRTRVALEYAKLAYFALVVRCDGEIWLLTIYAKSVRENIPGHTLKAIKEAIENA
jgi:hypothetical protein